MRWSKAKTALSIAEQNLEDVARLFEKHEGLIKSLQAAELRINELDPDSERNDTSRRWLAGALIQIQDRLSTIEQKVGLVGNEDRVMEAMRRGPEEE